MAFEGIKKVFFDDNEKKDSTVDDYYTVSNKQLKDEDGKSGSKMILVEPRAYSESQQIADYLKNRCAVVVNLKRVTPDQAKRIVDFLYGTIYAIGGNLQKLGGGIFLCTPNNVNVEGKISEDITNNKAPRGKKESEDKDEEDFF